MELPTEEFMHFAATFTHVQLAALESEHARRLDAAVVHWLDCGGDYQVWWNAVAAANTYLVKGHTS